MEVLHKFYHDASIQSVINQYGVSRSTLYDIKEIVKENWNLC
jgi:ACT domain-containing protein